MKIRIRVGNRSQRVHEIAEPNGLQWNIGFALRVDIDRHQVILAVDLQPVAGIEYQCDRIRTARGHLGGEIADGLAHVVLRQIGRRGDVEAGIAEQLRHSFAVVCCVGQRRHRAIGRLADDQRHAAFRERDMSGAKLER